MLIKRPNQSICSIFLYIDLERDIALNVMSEGDSYVFSGGQTGEYRLLKSDTSLLKLKQHWEGYVDNNKNVR